MRIFKTSCVLMLAVFFIACGSSESTNTNSSQSAPPIATPVNSNVSAPPAPPAPTPSSNANQSMDAKPMEEKKDAKTEAKTEPNRSGAALYTAQKCGGCHGPDGKGKIKGVPDFSDAAWQKKTSDAAMTEQIKKGKLPKMPAYEGKLSDAEIKALIGFIRSFAK
ncbi:MAG: c-type cytochrome [Acidobacteriota bacterium]